MIKVSYLGLLGSYSYIAGCKYFGEKNMIPNKSITDIFTSIVSGKTSYGIVPMENSTTGSIIETFDLLIRSNLTIVGEVILKINHHFLVNKHYGKIKYCYSHPQTTSQCRSFLDIHPEIRIIFTNDTASAAKIVSEGKRKDEGAIASIAAAKIYCLKILHKNINADKTNSTRFAVIAKKPNFHGNKISLAFSIKHMPGSLFLALKPYKDAGLNLTKIESRPILGKPWQYRFFLDFKTEGNQEKVKDVICQMKKRVQSLIILGKYENGKVYEA